ncbi:MAG: hypothetical protein WCT12_14630 [Verrucomicrobiota bacterium]
MGGDKRFYDSKGIDHGDESSAEIASRRYLEEEREARSKGVELQQKQAQATERLASQGLECQRQQAEAAERAASEARMQHLEQMQHSRRMEELKEAELIEQQELAQFQKDVAFLEGESEEARLDYLTKRIGLREGFAKQYEAPLRNRLLKMLDEIVDSNPGLKESTLVCVEKEKLLVSRQSALSEAERRLARLKPKKPKEKWVRVCFLVLSILFCWGIPYIIAAMAWRRAENNPDLSATTEEVQRLTLETQALEPELKDLKKRRFDALRKRITEFVGELDVRRVVSSMMSQEEYVGMVRDCVERFQENLPNRCRINPALVSATWCEESYQSLIKELTKRAIEFVEVAALNKQAKG